MHAAALALALAGPPSEVPAPPVVWQAPRGCPTLDGVQDRISDLLGRSVDPGEFDLDGRITAAGTGWTLTLVIRAGNVVDERTLYADDCSVLAETAALVAVVMIDPVVAADSIETSIAQAETEPATPASRDATPSTTPELEPEPEPEPDPTLPPPREETPARARTPRGPLGVFARLRGGGEFGAIPRGTGGGGLALAVGTDRIRGELEGMYWFGRSAEVDDGSATVSLGSAAARVCGLVPLGPVALPICGGLELGGMRATSTAPNPQDATRIFVAIQAEAGVRWAFARRASLWASAQGFAPVVFPRFQIELPDDASPSIVHRPAPVGVRGLVGIEVRLRGLDPAR